MLNFMVITYVTVMKADSNYVIHIVGMILFIVYDENYIKKLINLILIPTFTKTFWNYKLCYLVHICLQHLLSLYVVIADGRDWINKWDTDFTSRGMTFRITIMFPSLIQELLDRQMDWQMTKKEKICFPWASFVLKNKCTNILFVLILWSHS